MNKTAKIVVALLACLTLTGTALAAPHRGHTPAPIHHRVPAPRHHHHTPPPPPPRHHVVHHVEHHECGAGIALGAAAIGAVVGGIIGAIAN